MFDESLGNIWYVFLVGGVLYNLATVKWNSIPKILFLINCVYRSILPRIDASRHCFIGGWYSNILYGRILATLGEIGFALEVKRLFEASYNFSKFVERDPKMSPILHVLFNNFMILSVIIAQCFCWLAVTSGSDLFHVIEESIWCTMGLYVFVRSVIFTSIKRDIIKVFYINCTLISGLYIAYMFTLDVPMYLHRSLEVKNPTPTDFNCVTVSNRISDFGISAVQFLGYFTLGPQVLENIVWMRKRTSERTGYVV